MKIVLFVALMLVSFALMGSATATDGDEKEDGVFDFIKKGIPVVILVAGSYIGAFLGSLIIKDEREGTMFNMGLYGSVGWVAGFLVHYFELLNLTELGMVMSFVVFALLGMVSFVAFTLLDKSGD